MATMMFYDNIAPLNRERHADLRLKQARGDCSFARNAQVVPLAGTEFYQAASDYPVLFAGDKNEPTPIALLGLREGHNAFVEADGSWRRGTYVPAFVRRYPFVLARGDDEDSDNLTVCIDESYEGFVHGGEEGDPLFDAEGQQTPMLERTVRFLQQYLAESERTRTFVKRMVELGLLVRRDVQLTDAEGNQYALRDFRVIDAEQVDKLADETVIELHRQGYLGWIHAQLVSMSRLERMPLTLARAA